MLVAKWRMSFGYCLFYPRLNLVIGCKFSLNLELGHKGGIIMVDLRT